MQSAYHLLLLLLLLHLLHSHLVLLLDLVEGLLPLGMVALETAKEAKYWDLSRNPVVSSCDDVVAVRWALYADCVGLGVVQPTADLTPGWDGGGGAARR